MTPQRVTQTQTHIYIPVQHVQKYASGNIGYFHRKPHRYLYADAHARSLFVYMSVPAQTHTNVHVNSHIMHTHIHSGTLTNTHTKCIPMHGFNHSHTASYVRLLLITNIHTHKHVYKYIHTCSYAHMHIHAIRGATQAKSHKRSASSSYP